MHTASQASSRELLRVLRSAPSLDGSLPELPESRVWRAYCELRRRGEDRAETYFVRTVRAMHRRRAIAATPVPINDPNTTEHKLVDDALLGELWKAYKRCLCTQRTAPAGQLLRDIEAQITSH